MTTDSKKPDTLLTHAGRHPEDNFGVVNPPVYHASTILHPNVAHWEGTEARRFEDVVYGRLGTPTQFALEEAMAALEGGFRAVTVCSGAAACFTGLLAFLKAGDHVLIPDSVYGPVRNFANGFLARFGVEGEFYDPLIGAGIEALIRPNTRAIYLESPGSLTFEVQDVPAIVAVAKRRGIPTMLDNTWSSPLFLKPLAMGVDVAIIAGTKYVVGHSDVMMGICVTTEESYLPVKRAAMELGYHAAPDDAYLALRGLRTAGVRMRAQEQTALRIAHWLKGRPEVARVLHPALPDCPGHDFWRRDFTGSSGLFSIVLRPETPKPAIDAMLDGMELFGLGASWGGFESLIVPARLARTRSVKPWPDGPVLRLHVGLEDEGDLIADLTRGFERLNRARSGA
ncbi:MAG: cystathionine beta-lyase [Stellaceae bacterium]